MALPSPAADGVRGGRSFTAASWLVLSMVILMMATAALFLALIVTRPSDGARLHPGDYGVWRPDGVAVTPLRDHAGGLREGDVVVAVDGAPLTSLSERVLEPLDRLPRRAPGDTASYTVIRNGEAVDVPVEFGPYPLGEVLRWGWGGLLFAGSQLALGLFVFARRPGDPAARILLIAATGLASSMVWAFGLQVDDLTGGPTFWMFHVLIVGAYTVCWVGFLHFWLLFPAPSTFSARRWLVASLYIVPLVFHLAFLSIAWSRSSNVLEWLGRADADIPFIESTYLFLALVAIAWRYRTVRDPIGRRQVRWVVYVAFLVAAHGLVLGMLPQVLLDEQLMDRNTVALLALPLPLTLGVAVLRYRLFDIEPIVARIVVYGTLTALIIGVYVVVVGYLGAQLQATQSLVLSMVATGLVAVAFSPARAWLQGAVTRLLYGERDDPYRALSRLGERLEADLEADAVLPAAAESVARALKLPFVAVTLSEAGESRVVASYGASEHTVASLPLVFQGQPVGELLIAPRQPDEPLTGAEVRLLQDLARHVAVVAYSVHLAANLQRSRQEILAVREEERRRLRRDLHDGLGPALASVTLKLDAAGNLLRRRPEEADALLGDVAHQVREAVSGIRSLVYALRPPSLDELGLVGALREYAAQLGTPSASGDMPRAAPHVELEVTATSDLEPLPAAVEVAAYRIATEAMTNAFQHAHARTCSVSLALEDGRTLVLSIVDDGVGIARGVPSGVGLVSMRERAAELGGTCTVQPANGRGTRVEARLPLASGAAGPGHARAGGEPQGWSLRES